MGDAMEELDAVLSGRGWDLGGTYDGTPQPGDAVRLGSSACYVVLAVLFNDEVRQRPKNKCPQSYAPQGDPKNPIFYPKKDGVLLVQEAKAECRGTWYLPAGRMEPGESVVAALRREVKEETGLECEPLTLLALEERGPAWLRFVFLARPTGG